MTNTTIDISLTLDGSTAGRIISCLKKHDPKVWEVLKEEMKKELDDFTCVESQPPFNKEKCLVQCPFCKNT